MNIIRSAFPRLVLVGCLGGCIAKELVETAVAKLEGTTHYVVATSSTVPLEITTSRDEQSLTGRVWFEIHGQPADLEDRKATLRRLNVVLHDVEQLWLTSDGEVSNLGTVTVELADHDQVVTWDPGEATFSGSVDVLIAHPEAGRILGYGDEEEDYRFSPSQVGTLSFTLQLADFLPEEPYSNKVIEEGELIYLTIWGDSEEELLAVEMQLPDVESVTVERAWAPYWFPKAFLPVKPIFFGNGSTSSGEHATLQFTGAKEHWNRGALDFVVGTPETVNGGSLNTICHATGTTFERDFLEANMEIRFPNLYPDAIEVYFCKTFEHQLPGVPYFGGGLVTRVAPAEVRVIITDEADEERSHLLAHELGHAFRLLHPNQSPQTGMRPGDEGTVMCAMAWAGDSPDVLSQWNAEGANNPLLSISLIAPPPAPNPDCVGGAADDCGACP